MNQTLGTPVLPVVRVAILAESRLTDIALPAELPLREILPTVARLLPNGDDIDEPERVGRPLSLAPVGGAPFSLDASLDTVGVVDGDLLVLQPVPAGPAAPGIVEDIADAAVIFSESRRRPWGISHVQLVARAAAVLALLVATGFSVVHRVATGSAVSLYVIGVLALLSVISAVVVRGRDRLAGVQLSITALVPIAAVFALAVPGHFGPAQVVLASAGVTAWALITMIIGKDALSLFTAVTVVGAGVLLAGVVAALWQVSWLTLGCALVTLSVLVTVQAAALSALWARFPLPVIPAPGDPAPSAPSMRVLADLPHRVRVSDAHQSGFLAGAVLVSVLGSIAMVGTPEAVSPWAWYAVAATSVAAVLRARIWDSASCKAWLVAQPFLLLTVLTVLFVVQQRYPAALGTVAILVGLAGVWMLVAVNPRLAAPESYSLPMRRLVGFVAAGVDASLLPVLAHLVGLFTWVLNR